MDDRYQPSRAGIGCFPSRPNATDTSRRAGDRHEVELGDLAVGKPPERVREGAAFARLQMDRLLDHEVVDHLAVAGQHKDVDRDLHRVGAEITDRAGGGIACVADSRFADQRGVDLGATTPTRPCDPGAIDWRIPLWRANGRAPATLIVQA
jgi:hypothetical protein